MSKDSEHFLDKNTIIAIVFVFIAWFAWDQYMRTKYPPLPTKPPLTQKEEKQHSQKESLESSSNRKGIDKESLTFEQPEETFSFQSDKLSFQLSSHGMGFKKVVLNNVLDRQGKAIELFSGERNLPFETRVIFPGSESENRLWFKIKEINPGQWEGETTTRGLILQKTMQVLPEKFLVNVNIKVRGRLEQEQKISTLFNQSYGFQQEKQSWFSSLFQPPDILSFFISSSSGLRRISLLSGEEDLLREESRTPPQLSVDVVALGTKYFGQAWKDTSEVQPSFQFMFHGGNLWLGRTDHRVLNPQQDFFISYQIFMGPKSLSLFQENHPELVEWVDFGWFSLLARGILKILQFFYWLTGNWGLAIILLTMLVRFLLLPLVLSSHRSMETMKKIQPLLQEIRTKFKKDPQRMNQEVLAVMKAHRANPIGGCLPMLLQVPVFWALWKALSNSYSLYRSPFVFWIQDLSWKDPYYVLPVLIGILMFIQQKISPMTVSKEIARMMNVLPVFITLFMINFPSGLTLYVFVSSSFGLVQQFFLNASQTKTLLEKKKNNKK